MTKAEKKKKLLQYKRYIVRVKIARARIATMKFDSLAFTDLRDHAVETIRSLESFIEGAVEHLQMIKGETRS